MIPVSFERRRWKVIYSFYKKCESIASFMKILFVPLFALKI